MSNGPSFVTSDYLRCIPSTYPPPPTKRSPCNRPRRC